MSSEPHPVLPGGPPCNPNCPGPWSQYHDGYADAWEMSVAAYRADLADRIGRLPRLDHTLHPSPNGSLLNRAAVLRLLTDGAEPPEHEGAKP